MGLLDSTPMGRWRRFRPRARGSAKRSTDFGKGVPTDCSALLDCNRVIELIREEGRPVVVGTPLGKGIPCRGCLA